MFEVGQAVYVIDQRPAVVGQITEMSTWLKRLGKPAEDIPCYFVRVSAWNKGTNGGRWLSPSALKPISTPAWAN